MTTSKILVSSCFTRTLPEATEAEAVAPEVGVAGPAEATEMELVDVDVAGGAEGTPSVPAGVGGNFFTGVLSGAAVTFCAPELRALQQRAGCVASIAAHLALGATGTFLARGPCRGISQALNCAMQPFLSGDGIFTKAVHMVAPVVGWQVGQFLGNALRSAEEAEVPAGPLPRVPKIYRSPKCVICQQNFHSGDPIVTLDCGHACICQKECFQGWQAMIDRPCPVCRTPNRTVCMIVMD